MKPEALASRIENKHRRAGSKQKSHALYKAIKNHKKIPEYKSKPKERTPEQQAYKSLSINSFLKKYPEWRV